MGERKGGRSRTASTKPTGRREATSLPPSKFSGKRFFDPKAAVSGESGAVEVSAAERLRGARLQLTGDLVPRTVDDVVAVPPMVAVTGAQHDRHREQGCPGCDRPAQVQLTGWPASCLVRVTEFVRCQDTASAADSARRGKPAHHYACTFWDHYPGEVPF